MTEISGGDGDANPSSSSSSSFPRIGHCMEEGEGGREGRTIYTGGASKGGQRSRTFNGMRDKDSPFLRNAFSHKICTYEVTELKKSFEFKCTLFFASVCQIPHFPPFLHERILSTTTKTTCQLHACPMVCATPNPLPTYQEATAKYPKWVPGTQARRG